MTKTSRRFGAAAAVLALAAGLGYCGGLDELRGGAGGFGSGGEPAELISARQLEAAVPQPAEEKAGGRDIFKEIKACNAVDRTFVMRPATADALKMLAPCMKAVSKRYGNNVYAEATIMDPDAIRIVVLDSVAGKTIAEDLAAALAGRQGALFGHKVTLAVMDVSAKAPRIELLSDAELDRMVDRHQSGLEEARKKAEETKKKLRALEGLLAR